MPMTAFIGVRISWLMVARKTLFDALAASATRRASSASAKSRALSSAMDASWARRCEQIDVGLRERAAVRRCSRHAERSDDVGPGAQRCGHERRDHSLRECRVAPFPGVVVVDGERLAGLPDAAGDAVTGAHAAPEVQLEQPGRDTVRDHVLARAREVDEAVGSVEQSSRRARSAHAAARRGRGAA